MGAARCLVRPLRGASRFLGLLLFASIVEADAIESDGSLPHRVARAASGMWGAMTTVRQHSRHTVLAVAVDEEKDDNFVPPLSLLVLGDATHVAASSAASAQPLSSSSRSPDERGNHTAVPLTLSAMSKEHHLQLPRRSWFAFTLSFAFAVKAACMLSNIIFSVSPIPQVREFSKKRDTGPVDAAPFISILYGGFQWCFYGLFAYLVTQKSGFLVLVYSNALGAVLGCYYVWGFYWNCQNNNALQRLRRYSQVACMVVLFQMFAILVLSRRRALLFCGLVSSVCSVVGACSLLATLPVVLETKCSASINLPLTVVGFFSGWLWLTCGFVLWDAWIILPNIGNLTLNMITLSMLFYFPRNPEEAEAAKMQARMPITPSCLSPAPPGCIPQQMPIVREFSQGSEDSEAFLPGSYDWHPSGETQSTQAVTLPLGSGQQQLASSALQSAVPHYGSTQLRMPLHLWQTTSSDTAARVVMSSLWGSCGETGGTM